MARLSRDSEDEFPDLTVVISKYRLGTRSKTSKEKESKSFVEKLVCNDAIMTSTTKLPRIYSHTLLEASENSVLNLEKPAQKREVLNKMCENPLLQSLDIVKENRQIHLFSNRSNSTESESTISTVQENFTLKSPQSLGSAWEDGDLSTDDYMRLSDFIVNDSSFLEEDSTDEEVPRGAPRPTRKLVRGRRSPARAASEKDWSNPVNHRCVQNEIIASAIDGEPCGEDDDRKIGLGVCNNISSNAVPRDVCIITLPPSPPECQKRLLSPRKGTQIPMTPHRPNMDAFWDPGVINEWNEEYSPRKSSKLQDRIIPPSSSIKRSQTMRNSIKCNAKKLFALKKHDIADAFLRELDESVTDGKIAEMAALTGGISIIWSKKLNTTAGRANWRRETVRTTARDMDGNQKIMVTYRHHASIELAEKVINDEERLLNVIAHEFCHLANFMVSGIRNNPHGKEFKKWAAKCSQHFGDRGIVVTTKHSYDIDYKYVWECIGCGIEYKRHSKSIDPIKHQCRSCKSKLIQVKPIPRSKAVMSEYQTFVKENMGKVRKQNPGSPQKQIMTMVGKMYQDFKASESDSLQNDVERMQVGNGNDIRLREESTEVGIVDLVTRKLNFLDLTIS